jgi:hypothetical protein
VYFGRGPGVGGMINLINSENSYGSGSSTPGGSPYSGNPLAMDLLLAWLQTYWLYVAVVVALIIIIIVVAGRA